MVSVHGGVGAACRNRTDDLVITSERSSPGCKLYACSVGVGLARQHAIGRVQVNWPRELAGPAGRCLYRALKTGAGEATPQPRTRCMPAHYDAGTQPVIIDG